MYSSLIAIKMKIMRKYILLAAAAMFCVAAYAQNPVNRTGDVFTKGVRTSNVQLYEQNGAMNVAMDLDYSAASVSRKESLDIVPVITDGTHTVELPAIGLYGGNRYYKFLREGGKVAKGAKLYKTKNAPATEHYTAKVPYESWMDNCQLLLKQTSRGCCNSTLGQGIETLAALKYEFRFSPEFLFVQPVAEAVKARSEKGEAHLEYAVGNGNVDPNFKNNSAEIKKITDLVNQLSDNVAEYRVNEITLKGYASPDGGFATNEKLAKARTNSLKTLVQEALNDDKISVKTDFEAEDWAGVAAFVEKSSLAKKDEILDIVRGTLAPDQKERKLKASYPAQWKTLKDECFPALRRATYNVGYEVVPYVDVDQIKNKIETNPKDLSLNEFFMAANSCQTGSPEFIQIMEKALQQYPSNEIAKVNAANAAMSAGNLARAEELLSTVSDGGSSNQAPLFTYAKALYEAMSGNFAKAAQMFTSIKDKVPQAKAALEQLAKARY